MPLFRSIGLKGYIYNIKDPQDGRSWCTCTLYHDHLTFIYASSPSCYLQTTKSGSIVCYEFYMCYRGYIAGNICEEFNLVGCCLVPTSRAPFSATFCATFASCLRANIKPQTIPFATNCTILLPQTFPAYAVFGKRSSSDAGAKACVLWF